MNKILLCLLVLPLIIFSCKDEQEEINPPKKLEVTHFKLADVKIEYSDFPHDNKYGSYSFSAPWNKEGKIVISLPYWPLEFKEQSCNIYLTPSYRGVNGMHDKAYVGLCDMVYVSNGVYDIPDVGVRVSYNNEGKVTYTFDFKLLDKELPPGVIYFYNTIWGAELTNHNDICNLPQYENKVLFDKLTLYIYRTGVEKVIQDAR